MNRKQKDITDFAGDIPADVTTVAGNPDYLSCQRMTVNENVTPLEAYVQMTSSQPKWLGLLFTVRDTLSRFAGVKPVGGFGKIELKEYEVDQYLHFFRITEKTDKKLTLVVEDRHLDVCFCISLAENNRASRTNVLYLITSVKNKNFFGRLYMLPVSLAHPLIAKRLLMQV